MIAEPMPPTFLTVAASTVTSVKWVLSNVIYPSFCYWEIAREKKVEDGGNFVWMGGGNDRGSVGRNGEVKNHSSRIF